MQELQNDLEVEQVKVNSLTHMVVVVDENSGESTTAALEEQLQVRRQTLRKCVRHKRLYMWDFRLLFIFPVSFI